MSEQAKILEELHAIIMEILSSGSASEDQGKRIDELEALLHQQKCYQEIEHAEHDYLGEEIAALFNTDHYVQAIEKLCEHKITPEDFFGFITYHDEEEEFTALFTDAFMQKVQADYNAKCQE